MVRTTPVPTASSNNFVDKAVADGRVLALCNLSSPERSKLQCSKHKKVHLIKSVVENGELFSRVSYIGKGSFGFMFKCADKGEFQRRYALKISRSTKRGFEKEYYILRQLKSLNGIPTAHHKGFIEMCEDDGISRYDFITMTLLGKDLGRLLDATGGRFSAVTVVLIALECFKILRDLHGKGFVHRDLKPDNLSVDRFNGDCIYLIDFGLAKEYNDLEQLREKNKSHHIVGSLRYASPSAMLGFNQFPADDMISFSYCLIYMFKGILPWMGISSDYSTKEGHRSAVLEQKENIDLDELCKRMPHELHCVLDMIHKLNYKDVPNYEGYILHLSKYIQRMKALNCHIKFDWLL